MISMLRYKKLKQKNRKKTVWYKCVPVPVRIHRHDVQGLLLVFLHSIKPALVHNLLCKLVRLEQLVELHGRGSL